MKLLELFSSLPELDVDVGKNFRGDSPSTTAPITWWILPWRELSLANRAAEALKLVETAGLKALREARTADF
jgi:hypothetical protein